MVVKCQEMGYPSMKNQKHFRRYPLKFPDMNQYITLLFSLLAEFFLPYRTQPSGAGGRPPRSHVCPRDEQDLQDLQD